MSRRELIRRFAGAVSMGSAALAVALLASSLAAGATESRAASGTAKHRGASNFSATDSSTSQDEVSNASTDKSTKNKNKQAISTRTSTSRRRQSSTHSRTYRTHTTRKSSRRSTARLAVAAQKRQPAAKPKPARTARKKQHIGAVTPVHGEAVTLQIQGLESEEGIKVVNEELGKVVGIKVMHRPTLRHPRAVVELTDLNKASLGDLAKVIAHAKTPDRDTQAPSAWLVLFDKNLKPDSGAAISKALEGVTGIDGKGTTIDQKAGEIVIPLIRTEKREDGASLATIMKAIEKSGLRVRASA